MPVDSETVTRTTHPCILDNVYQYIMLPFAEYRHKRRDEAQAMRSFGLFSRCPNTKVTLNL